MMFSLHEQDEGQDFLFSKIKAELSETDWTTFPGLSCGTTI